MGAEIEECGLLVGGWSWSGGLSRCAELKCRRQAVGRRPYAQEGHEFFEPLETIIIICVH